MKLTDERSAKMNIELLLASHSYIYPLGIAEDILVEVAEHVYPVDFVILDIKEDEKRPFILGTPFLTTAKAVIKFDMGTITLRSGKSKISFHRIPESLCKIERGVKNDIDPIAPTVTVNRLVLEWEERIKLHLEREIKFDQWKSKKFKSKHPALVKVKGEMDDEGEGTYVVPTGRVKVPAGRYVVPTSKENVIFSTGRTKLIPAGRTILVLIMNSDHNLWNIILNGNSRKRTGRDPKGNVMILPPVSVKENIVVQRETKARTILLQYIPEDHMANFHHLDDARDIWLAVKARFGGNDESKKMRKLMLKQEFLEFRVSESEGLHKGYDRFQK
ncbi:reverse transcriptase domain-containing protein, partial [Tanacetum coccineum]